jgi:hypothetical protein
MAKRSSDCPAQDCSANSTRQSELNPAYYAEIPEASRAKIEARTQNGIIAIPMMRCNYCGCVYGQFAARKHIFGWLDNGATGKKWSESADI